MPKKKTFIKKVDEKTDIEIVVERKEDEEPDPKFCWNCKQPLNIAVCRKGDNNQYKFCSVECFNKSV